MQIADGEITVTLATEGIESKADMEISGGVIRILQATDDGINTGGGMGMGGGMGNFDFSQFMQNDENTEDAATTTDTTDVTEDSATTTDVTTASDAAETQPEMPDMSDMTDSASSTSHDITISGGSIYVNADGDGIDSNGSITLTGGTVWVSGPVSGADGAIDFETDMTMTGGSIIALSSHGMMEYPSTQHYCTTSASAQAGDFIAVCDADGNVLMGIQTQKAVSDIVYYGTEMEDCQLIINGTYSGTLSEDGTAVDGTVTDGTTVEWSLTDGTEQSGFGGGFGGGDMKDFMNNQDNQDGTMPDFADGEMPEMPEGATMPDFSNDEMPEMPDGGNGEAPEMPQGGQDAPTNS
jgi:hypothetical protein